MEAFMKQLLVAAFLLMSILGKLEAEPQGFRTSLSGDGAIPAVQSSRASETLAGNWVGEYRLDGKTTYVSATFRLENGSISGTMISPLLENDSQRRSFNSVSLEGNRVRFQFQQSSVSTVFEGEVESGSIKGKVTRGNSDGLFELIHLYRITPDLFDNYVGDYKTDEGRFVIVGRSLGSLYYFDLLSGRTGPLLATSETDFFGGPSNGVSYPVDAKVHFQKASDGSITALTFSLGGQPAVSAKKIKFYNVEEVAFQNGNVKLSGSLRTPITAGPYRAVVMLAGSNAQSRYGQDCIMGFNADYLARLGFAVLTYDKRGTGKSTGGSGRPRT
jgi:hypothetical protein